MSDEAHKLVENLLGGEFDDDVDPKSVASSFKAEDDAEAARLKASGIVSPKTVSQYGHIFHKTARKADGTAVGVKVTSVKTWARRPDYWEIKWKYGLRDYGTITPRNADDWTTVEPQHPKLPRKKRA